MKLTLTLITTLLLAPLAALIAALQQTVWSVVAGHPHSGVKKPRTRTINQYRP